jgi:HSP20 family molecular chaperone IbpA
MGEAGMAIRETELWMWSDACEMLARAERLQSQFFRPQQGRARLPAWEPPVDMFETAEAVLILVALPGVDIDGVEVVIDDRTLVVVGNRTLPAELRNAVIHRMELPQGRFERRLRLPPGRYGAVRRAAASGCLLVTLAKSL